MQRWADTTFSTGVRLPALSVVSVIQVALELVHRRSLAPLRRRCRPGTFLDRRSDLEVFGVIAEHACVRQEAVLGICGVGVADEEVRDELDLRFRKQETPLHAKTTRLDDAEALAFVGAYEYKNS